MSQGGDARRRRSAGKSKAANAPGRCRSGGLFTRDVEGEDAQGGSSQQRSFSEPAAIPIGRLFWPEVGKQKGPSEAAIEPGTGYMPSLSGARFQ